jgi:hypothetical protein
MVFNWLQMPTAGRAACGGQTAPSSAEGGDGASDESSHGVPRAGECLAGDVDDAKVGELGGAVGGEEDVGRSWAA